MLLALSVIGTDAARLGLNGYKVFDERGGVIGRLENSDWILRDPAHLVSACHARVIHRNKDYFIEDTSSNGTFINDPGRPVQREAATPLRDGDRLFIGSFEILVQLIDDLPVMVANAPQGDFDSLPRLSVEANDISHRPDRNKAATHSDMPSAPQKSRSFDTDMDSPRMAEHAGAVLRNCLRGALETLQAQLRMRQARGLGVSLSGGCDLSVLQRCVYAEDSARALLQELSLRRDVLAKTVDAAFQEIGFHDAAMLAAQQAAARALIEQLPAQRGDPSGGRDRDRGNPLQALFDAVFVKAYAQHVNELRSRAAHRPQVGRNSHSAES